MSLERKWHTERGTAYPGGRVGRLKSPDFPVNCEVFEIRVLTLVIKSYTNPTKLHEIPHQGVWSAEQDGNGSREEVSQLSTGPRSLRYLRQGVT